MMFGGKTGRVIDNQGVIILPTFKKYFLKKNKIYSFDFNAKNKITQKKQKSLFKK